MFATRPSSHPDVSTEDIAAALSLANEDFKPEENTAVVEASEEIGHWIQKTIPYCWRLIYDENQVIGQVFVLPVDKEMLQGFLAKEVNEAELFALAQEKAGYSWHALYVAGVNVLPAYRRRGLAKSALLETLDDICGKIGKKLPLFGWALSPEGRVFGEHMRQDLRARGYREIVSTNDDHGG